MSGGRSYCANCDEVESYKLDEAKGWECRAGGFAIECVECGLRPRDRELVVSAAERLRSEVARQLVSEVRCRDLMSEAADELDRLRDERDRLHEALIALLPVFEGDCYFDHHGDCQQHHAGKVNGRCAAAHAAELMADVVDLDP